MEFPGEQLLIKMWETLIEKGIGGLIEPYYTPWRNKKVALGQIEVDKIIKDAKTSAEKEIKQIGNNEPLLIEQNQTTSNYNNISQPISVQDIVIQNNAKRLIREEINVTNSIKYASQRLINDNSEVPKTEINDDWLNAWRENASKVSDEQVQSLWGSVLAQEFIEPGRYSLRLLEFLKTLSKEEALLIEKIAPFISGNWLIFKRYDFEDDIFKEFDIKESELEFIESLGLFYGVFSGGKVATAKNHYEEEGKYLTQIKVGDERIIMISSDDKDKKVQYNLYELSKLGAEILSLINVESNLDYIKWLGNQFKNDFRVDILKKINETFQIEITL